jgi:hypothetical protein
MNLYATLTELKAGMPDGVQAATTKYDAQLLRLANQGSRLADAYCGRFFYPRLGTRYFHGNGRTILPIDDLLTLTSVAYSTDGGATYTTLDIGVDVHATHWDDHNDVGSYTSLFLDPNGDLSAWPDEDKGRRTVKVVGEWAFAEDRATAWESTGITPSLQLGTGGGTLSIATGALDTLDIWKMAAAIHVGRLLKIESEIVEVVATTDGGTGADTAAVLRGRNGSVDAAHGTGADISIWRPPANVVQAVIITSNRSMERGFQGFGDSRANAEVGSMFYLRALDPEAKALLDPYRIVQVG